MKSDNPPAFPSKAKATSMGSGGGANYELEGGITLLDYAAIAILSGQLASYGDQLMRDLADATKEEASVGIDNQIKSSYLFAERLLKIRKEFL